MYGSVLAWGVIAWGERVMLIHKFTLGSNPAQISLSPLGTEQLQAPLCLQRLSALLKGTSKIAIEGNKGDAPFTPLTDLSSLCMDSY